MKTSCAAPASYDEGVAECGDAAQRLLTVLKDMELKHILSVLERQGGNQRRTAEALGLRPTTLHEKLKRFGVLEKVRELRVQPSPPPPKEDGEVFRYRCLLRAGETLEIVGDWQAVDVAASWDGETEVRLVRWEGSPPGPPIRAQLAQVPSGVRIAFGTGDSAGAPDVAVASSLRVLLPHGARLLATRSGGADIGTSRRSRPRPKEGRPVLPLLEGRLP
jgi:hypothetical protein